MALPRPLVSVYDATNASLSEEVVAMPTVMQAPIRPDLVSFVHYNVARNSRQAYGVKENAGYQTSAESWGTGRAVARIPRVPGGGTHRAGQAAFGNFCRGGGMFAPTKTWRRWHRHVNKKQRRHAVASAIAASAYTSLVVGRGHKISNVPEIPLVVSDEIQSINKTKNILKTLDQLGCSEDMNRCKDSKKVRAGKGKARNRRYVLRRGPLLVFFRESGLVQALRNVPGVKAVHVDRLNLLDLAPGGTLGRFIVWTKSAFERLQKLYGDYDISEARIKKNYLLHRPVMANVDLNRIINSNEIQSQLRAQKEGQHKAPKKYNLLTNRSARIRIDPFYKSRLGLIKRCDTKFKKTGELVEAWHPELLEKEEKK